VDGAADGAPTEAAGVAAPVEAPVDAAGLAADGEHAWMTSARPKTAVTARDLRTRLLLETVADKAATPLYVSGSDRRHEALSFRTVERLCP
jgi:hypothetical protein